MKNILKILIIIPIAIFSLFLPGCKKENSNEPVLVMGTSLDYPPYEFSKNGEAMGFDIDVAHALAKELSFKLEIKDIDFSSLIGALKSGRVDFVMAGMSQDEERKKNVDFTESYYEADRNALITLKDKVIDSEDRMVGKKIGTQQGTVQETHLKELQKKIQGLEILALGRNPQLIQEVKVGRIDGVFISEIQAKEFVRVNPDLAYHSVQSEQQGVAIALKKDSELTGRFNKGLTSLKEKGILAELKSKWFSGESSSK